MDRIRYPITTMHTKIKRNIATAFLYRLVYSCLLSIIRKKETCFKPLQGCSSKYVKTT